jgi:hypothetical protein
MKQVNSQTDHPTDALPDYARGRAESPDAIERHLAGCETCRAELEILRALADAPVEDMTAIEREDVYRGFARRRATGGGWKVATWRIAAAIALLLTGVGVWQIFKTSQGAGGWDPQIVIEAWEEDLVDLQLPPGEVRLALGFDGPTEEGLGVPWEELEAVDFDPLEMAAPWEEDR